jgi:hypothetical protein
VFTEPLLAKILGIHMQTHKMMGGWRGIIKHATEMGSGVMIYIPSFTKIGSGNYTFTGGKYTDTQTTWRPHTTILFFSK